MAHNILSKLILRRKKSAIFTISKRSFSYDNKNSYMSVSEDEGENDDTNIFPYSFLNKNGNMVETRKETDPDLLNFWHDEINFEDSEIILRD